MEAKCTTIKDGQEENVSLQVIFVISLIHSVNQLMKAMVIAALGGELVGPMSRAKNEGALRLERKRECRYDRPVPGSMPPHGSATGDDVIHVMVSAPDQPATRGLWLRGGAKLLGHDAIHVTVSAFATWPTSYSHLPSA